MILRWPVLSLAVIFSFRAFSLEVKAPAFPTNEDLRHIRNLEEPRLSPDGHQILLRVIDPTAEGGKSHLWIVDINNNTARQITYSPDSDKAGELEGEWMPDGGSILFLGHRGEHNQLFRLPTTGGEAKPYDLKIVPALDNSKLPDAVPPPASPVSQEKMKLEALPVDVVDFAIAPDGRGIAVLARDPQTPGEKKQAEAKADARWVDHETHNTRLYLLDPESTQMTLVTVPANVHQVFWSLTKSELLAISEEPNGAGDLKPCSSTWLVKRDDPAHPIKLAKLPPTIQRIAWSPDGESISYLAQAEADTPPGYRDLFEYNFASQASRNLTGRFNGSIGFQPPIFLSDRSILVAAGQGFTNAFLRFAPAHTQFTPVRLQTPFATSVTGSLNTNRKQTGWVFLGSDSTHAPTLFYTDSLQQVARVLQPPPLAPTLSRAAMSKRISWKSDQLTIEGLLYLPPEASHGKVPMVVEVHGGPLSAYLDDYSPFVQFLVGHGWAVLRTNPRGSTNYGAAFAAANRNDLGGGDYRDIMAGVDTVLKTEPVDPGKLALEGYSYGGEMAGFAEVKTSRFKAIISGAPVIDQYSEYGTEGGSYYDRWYYGRPWEHPQDAWRQSPLSGVTHAATPFLLLQGEADTTDPLGQSQEMYRALRQVGVPVDLITYPRESHGSLVRGIYGQPVPEPWHGFDARQRILKVLEKAFQ